MDYSLIDLGLLFLLGGLAGVINVVAGGGSSITLPFLIFMGLDASVANGTNRIGVLSQTLAAVVSFKKENYSDFSLSMKLSLLTIPGAIIGSIYSTYIDSKSFEMILAIVMIGIVITILIPDNKKNELKETVLKMPFLAYPLMVIIGFYGGFIQVGIGFILMAFLTHIMRLNLIKVNMHKVFIVTIYTIPSLVIFYMTDNIEWFAGIVLAVGTSIGSWFAVKLSIEKGEKFVKLMLVVSILLMSFKLLGVF